jgi:hypothetical protein
LLQGFRFWPKKVAFADEKLGTGQYWKRRRDNAAAPVDGRCSRRHGLTVAKKAPLSAGGNQPDRRSRLCCRAQVGDAGRDDAPVRHRGKVSDARHDQGKSHPQVLMVWTSIIQRQVAQSSIGNGSSLLLGARSSCCGKCIEPFDNCCFAPVESTSMILVSKRCLAQLTLG